VVSLKDLCHAAEEQIGVAAKGWAFDTIFASHLCALRLFPRAYNGLQAAGRYVMLEAM